MLEAENRNIEGMDFQLHPLPALKAAKLDKEVVALLIPVMGGFKKGFNADSEIDLDTMVEGISQALTNMDGKRYENFIVELLSTVVLIRKGSQAVQLSAELIDTEFSGKLGILYRLCFEVMKYNKFAPFVLMGDGKLIQTILTSPDQKKKQSQNGSKSARSANLLET